MLKMLVLCDSQRVRNNNVLRCDGLCILVENPLKFHNIVLILCPFSLVIENILSCDKLIEVVLIYCGYFRVKKLFTYNEQSLNFIYLNLNFFISCNCGEQSNTFNLCVTPTVMWFLRSTRDNK